MSRCIFWMKRMEKIPTQFRKPCFLCFPFLSSGDALLPCATNNDDVFKTPHHSVQVQLWRKKVPWWMPTLKNASLHCMKWQNIFHFWFLGNFWDPLTYFNLCLTDSTWVFVYFSATCKCDSWFEVTKNENLFLRQSEVRAHTCSVWKWLSL